MAPTRFVTPSALALALALSIPGLATAQTAAKPAQPAAKPAKAAATPTPKTAKKAPAKATGPTAATPEQVDAAGRVFYGAYDCEMNQSVNIAASSKYPSYVTLKHLKSEYLMKPVLTSTGAVRLEDTRGETLMLQIANKSMLLNVKTGRRMVDDCVSPKQRELVAAAKASKTSGSSMFGSGK